MARPGRLADLASRVGAGFAAAPSGPVVIALSGGADSAICGWGAREAGRVVRAVHIDHGLAASEVMASAAVSIAGALELTLAVCRVTVPADGSFEAAARAVRYDALTAGLAPEEWLLTGHTRDDQAETVLAHLLRGSGLDGLAGIPPTRPPVHRPLLDVSRSEIRELATLLGLPWRDDPANDDVGPLRNRLRRRLLPMLEGEYSAGVAQMLSRSAAVVRSEIMVLDRLADTIPRVDAPGAVRLALGGLAAAVPPVAGRAVRRAVAHLRPPHPPLSTEVTIALGVAAGRRRSAALAGGVGCRRVGPWLELYLEPGPEDVPAPAELVAPGSGWWGRYRFEFVVGNRPTVIPLSLFTVTLPVQEGPITLTVRAAAAEDELELVVGHKRVFDVLADAGIASTERRRHPVVEAGGRIVWIPGVRRIGCPAPKDVPAVDRYLVAVASKESDWERSAP